MRQESGRATGGAHRHLEAKESEQDIGVDAALLLADVLCQTKGFEQGCWLSGRRCVLILGPAACGKTTLLRRFVMDALEAPGQVVPLFIAATDLATVRRALRGVRCGV